MAKRRRRRTSRRRTSSPRRNSRKGSTATQLLVGTTIGAGAAIGTGALVSQLLAMTRKEGEAPTETQKTIAQFSPLVGAGAIAALGMLVPKYKMLTTSALIGGGLMFALQMYQASKAKNGAKGYYGAGRYPMLRGAGNVANTINAPRGAGNVARTLDAVAY